MTTDWSPPDLDEKQGSWSPPDLDTADDATARFNAAIAPVEGTGASDFLKGMPSSAGNLGPPKYGETADPEQQNDNLFRAFAGPSLVDQFHQRTRDRASLRLGIAEQHKLKYHGNVLPVQLEIEVDAALQANDQTRLAEKDLKIEQAWRGNRPFDPREKDTEGPGFLDRVDEVRRPVQRAGVETAGSVVKLLALGKNLPKIVFNAAGRTWNVDVTPSQLAGDLDRIDRYVDWYAPEPYNAGSIYAVTKFLSANAQMFLFGSWIGKLGGGVSRLVASATGKSAEAVAAAVVAGKEAAIARSFSALAVSSGMENSFKTAKAYGMTDAEAEQTAAFVGVLSYPLARWSMQWNPLIKYVRNGALPVESPLGKIGYAGTMNAVQSAPNIALNAFTQTELGLEQARQRVQGVTRNVDIEHRKDLSLLTSVVAHQIPYFLEEVGLAGGGGTLLGGFDALHNKLQRTVDPMFREMATNYLGQDPDVYSKLDAYRTFRRDFGANQESAMGLADVMHRMVSTMAVNEGIPPEAAWLQIVARQSERGMPGDTYFSTDGVGAALGMTLTARRLVQSPEYAQSFGERPVSTKQIYAWMVNKGVKQEELQATTLHQFNQHDERMSQKDVLKYLDEHEVRLTGLVKGNKTLENGQARIKELQEARVEAERKMIAAKSEEKQQWSDLMDKIWEEQGPLTQELPNRTAQYAWVNAPGPSTNYEEKLFFVEAPGFPGSARAGVESDSANERAAAGAFYQHWNEPNVLLHLRTDVRDIRDVKTGEVKPTYTMLENQSDLHQMGKKVGYASSETQATNERDLVEARARIEEIQREIARVDPDSSVGVRQIATLETERQDILGNIESMEKKPVPDLPFKQNWHELGLKAFLLDAVRKGYSRVAIPTGEFVRMVETGGRVEQLQGKPHPAESFYEKTVLPSLSKLVKRLDPDVKLGLGEVNVGSSTASYSPKWLPIITLDITPKMRDAITGGQMSFFTRRPFTTVAELKAAGRVRAIEGVDGKIYVGNSFSHIHLLDQTGLSRQQYKTDGWVQVVGDSFLYAGSDALMHGYAKTEIETKPTPVEKGKLVFVDTEKPHDLKNLTAKEFKLFSDERAAAVFLENGRAYIEALNSPKPVDALHEIFHIARRSLLPIEDVKALESELGVKDSVWTVEDEERAANMMLKWFKDAVPPSPQLRPAFDALQAQMKEGFAVAERFDLPISEEFGRIMDRMLVAETDTMRVKREQLNEVLKRIGSRAKKEAALEGDDTKLPDLARLRQEQLEDGRARDGLRVEINDLKSRYYQKEGETWPEARQRRIEQEYDAVKNLDERITAKLQNRAINWLKSGAVSTFQWLGEHPVTHFLFDNMYNAKVQESRLRARWDGVIRDLVLKTPRAVRESAQEIDQETGYSKFRSMFEERWNPHPVNVPPELLEYKQILDQERRWEDEHNIEKNNLRKLKSGNRVQAKPHDPYTLARLMTEEGFEFMSSNSPERDMYLRQAYVHGELPLAQQLGHKPMDFVQFEKAFNKEIESQRKMRRAGIIEFSRGIKTLPDAFVHPETGKIVRIFHTDPVEFLRKQTGTFARRAATLEYFGGGLKDVFEAPGPLRRTLKAFGLSATRKRVELEAMVLSSKLASAEEVKKLTVKGLRDRLEAADVDPDINPADMLRMVQQLGPADLQRTKVRDPKKAGKIVQTRLQRLRALGTELGGVDTKAPLETIIFQLKDRLSREIQDDVYKKLRKQYVNSGIGGSTIQAEGKFDYVWARFQDIPLTDLENSTLWQSIQLVWTPVAALQTSLAAVWNPLQAAERGAKLLGWKNMLGGFADALANPTMVRAKGMSRGAAVSGVHDWVFESSSLLKKVNRALKQGVGIVSLQQATLEGSNNVLLAGAERLVYDWRTEGIRSQQDQETASAVRLTADEVTEINAGRMTEFHEDKIVQGVLRRAVGHREPSFIKSRIENDPRLSMAFSYQQYAINQLRAFHDGWKDIKTAWKSGEPEKMVSASKSVLGLLALTVGAGAVRSMLKGYINGWTPQNDEDVYDMLGRGLADNWVMGSADRLVNPLGYDTSGASYLVSFSAPMGIIAKTIDFIRGQGRFGRYPWLDRFSSEVTTMAPAFRAFANQLDQHAYPELVDYRAVRRQVGRYKEQLRLDAGEDKDMGIYQQNPLYHDITEAMARQDLDLINETARLFYENQYKSGKDPTAVVANLRQSLLSHRPINLPTENKQKPRATLWGFLATIPLDERRKAMRLQYRYEALVDAIAPGR